MFALKYAVDCFLIAPREEHELVGPGVVGVFEQAVSLLPFDSVGRVALKHSLPGFEENRSS